MSINGQALAVGNNLSAKFQNFKTADAISGFSKGYDILGAYNYNNYSYVVIKDKNSGYYDSYYEENYYNCYIYVITKNNNTNAPVFTQITIPTNSNGSYDNWVAIDISDMIYYNNNFYFTIYWRSKVRGTSADLCTIIYKLNPSNNNSVDIISVLDGFLYGGVKKATKFTAYWEDLCPKLSLLYNGTLCLVNSVYSQIPSYQYVSSIYTISIDNIVNKVLDCYGTSFNDKYYVIKDNNIYYDTNSDCYYFYAISNLGGNPEYPSILSYKISNNTVYTIYNVAANYLVQGKQGYIYFSYNNKLYRISGFNTYLEIKVGSSSIKNNSYLYKNGELIIFTKNTTTTNTKTQLQDIYKDISTSNSSIFEKIYNGNISTTKIVSASSFDLINNKFIIIGVEDTASGNLNTFPNIFSIDINTKIVKISKNSLDYNSVWLFNKCKAFYNKGTYYIIGYGSRAPYKMWYSVDLKIIASCLQHITINGDTNNLENSFGFISNDNFKFLLILNTNVSTASSTKPKSCFYLT